MPREFDQGTIPGSDYEMNGYQDYEPLPKSPNWSGDNPWLPKTDWCCDKIIANED